MKILSYKRFALWWQLAMDWFQRQFAAIAASIDFTPVEEKLDDVKSDVADVKTAVEKQQLMPTAEVVNNGVRFHFVTLAQMEKMHVRAEGVSIIGFALVKGENDFELRFSSDSPQEIAGNLIFDDSIDIVDDVFETITIPLEGYVVSGVYLDGVDANLLEADINWRLSDIQKRIGEGGGGIEIMTDDEYEPALSDLENMLDDIDVTDEN